MKIKRDELLWKGGLPTMMSESKTYQTCTHFGITEKFSSLLLIELIWIALVKLHVEG